MRIFGGMASLLRCGAFGLLVAATGCGKGGAADAGAVDDGCTTDCADSGGDDGADGADDGVDDGADDGAPDDGSGDGSAAGGIPCDVAEALAANCWSCHGDTPQFGAPMPLTSRDDFLVPATTDATRAVHELVGERVRSEDMPMPADGSLSGADQATIVDWVSAAAPASDDECEDPDPDPDPDPGVGPDALDCEVTHSFTAHAAGGDDAFHVPQVDNLYQCFTFASPVAAETHITAWAPIVDDERVLHHWILYKSSTPQQDGGAGPCNMPGDAVFVAGWAPGGTNFEMPENIGLEFGGPNDYYILQMHYNNTAAHADALDKSGVALCTSPPKPDTAGIIWLGSTSISLPPNTNDVEVVGTCPSAATGLLPSNLNVIASFPHMHEFGRALTTEVYRGGAGGPMEMLVDATPFSFHNQVMYPHDPAVVINPGDELVTRCTYDNTTGQTVNFGENTEDEMCFNFIMAYPIQAIPPQARNCAF